MKEKSLFEGKAKRVRDNVGAVELFKSVKKAK